jgi:hypothetical protein
LLTQLKDNNNTDFALKEVVKITSLRVFIELKGFMKLDIYNNIATKNFKAIFYVLLFYYLINFFLFLILYLINIDLFNSTFQLLKANFSVANRIHPIYLVLIAPILEELQFRLPLDLKANSFFISLSIFLGNKTLSCLHAPLYYSEILILPLIQHLILYAIFYFMFVWVNETFLNKLKFKIPFNLVFFFSSIVFAAIHLLNFYPLESKFTFEYSVIILNQILAACLFGYLRCKYGLWSGIFAHGFINYF